MLTSANSCISGTDKTEREKFPGRFAKYGQLPLPEVPMRKHQRELENCLRVTESARTGVRILVVVQRNRPRRVEGASGAGG